MEDCMIDKMTIKQIENEIKSLDVDGKMPLSKIEQVIKLQIIAGSLSECVYSISSAEDYEIRRAHEEFYYERLIRLASECIRAMERIRE
jgi:hypothetical protein